MLFKKIKYNIFYELIHNLQKVYLYNYKYKIYLYLYILYKINFFYNYIYLTNKYNYKKKIVIKKINKKITKLGNFIINNKIKHKKKTYDLILRFRKKNLFLTFLNKNKNILIKNNIGSFGFKKKVKFTGFAIENSSLKFCKKIRKILYKKVTSNLHLI